MLPKRKDGRGTLGQMASKDSHLRNQKEGEVLVQVDGQWGCVAKGLPQIGVERQGTQIQTSAPDRTAHSSRREKALHH